MNKSLVLTQNERNADERFDWEDIEGEQYHFPNQYKNLFKQGSAFIYYRGVRRKNKKVGPSEYFGYGKIGEIWRDERIPTSKPKREWSWFCEVVDYVPFRNPVRAKKEDGAYFEEVKGKNYWRNGVRLISSESLSDIFKSAKEDGLSIDSKDVSLAFPSTNEIKISISDDLLISQKKIQGKHGSVKGRRSKISNEVGDVAEKIAEKYFQEMISKGKSLSNLKRVSVLGEKPGWDLQLEDGGELVAIEVKGTTGKKFSSIELTINEWNAAERMGDNYYLCLVSECRSDRPFLQIIKNISALYRNGKVAVEPLVMRLSLK